MYYLHGIPSGKVCKQTGMEPGSVVENFYRLARLFSGVPAQLIEEYRQGSVKHADETGWRVNGHNGYTWLFATPCPLMYRCRRSLRPGGLAA
jgi:transposase